MDFEKVPLIRSKHETIGKNSNDIEALWKSVEYVRTPQNSVELNIVYYILCNTECMCNCPTSVVTRCYDLGTQFMLFLSFGFLLHTEENNTPFSTIKSFVRNHWFEIQYIKHFVRLIAEFKYFWNIFEHLVRTLAASIVGCE